MRPVAALSVLEGLIRVSYTENSSKSDRMLNASLLTRHSDAAERRVRDCW